MTKADALPPVHLPYLQMIRQLPPRRDPFILTDDEEDGDPGEDAPPMHGGTHCGC
jgi:hypothetical protein